MEYLTLAILKRLGIRLDLFKWRSRPDFSRAGTIQTTSRNALSTDRSKLRRTATVGLSAPSNEVSANEQPERNRNASTARTNSSEPSSARPAPASCRAFPACCQPAAGAVVVQHEGAAAAAPQDGAEVVQHDEAVEEQPQACAGVAAKAPTDVVANTIESNLNMQISLKRNRGDNTFNPVSRSGELPNRDTTTSPTNYFLLTAELARIGLRQRP